MDETPVPADEPANLKFLRRLVTILTATMILGLLVVIGLLVTRFPKGASGLPLPDVITLDDGVTATAFTVGSDWFAVVTEDDKILVFDRDTGVLQQTLTIER